MESNQNCKAHNNSYEFFCFDEREYLCSQCFSAHKKHNIEIKCEILKKAEMFKNAKLFSKTALLDQYNTYYDKLKQQFDLISTEMKRVETILLEIKDSSFGNYEIPKNIFDLSYQEFENLSYVQDKFYPQQYYKDIHQDLKQYFKLKPLNNPSNMKWIRHEVKIQSSSAYYPSCPPSILLTYTKGDYYLSSGNANHWIIFDFTKEHFISKVKFVFSYFECMLKDFRVSVNIDEQGTKWDHVGDYQTAPYQNYVETQEFTLNCNARFLKFDFKNNWGPGGGNYILISKMEFLACSV